MSSSKPLKAACPYPHRMWRNIQSVGTLPELHQALRHAGAQAPKVVRVGESGRLDRFRPHELPDSVSVGVTQGGRRFVAVRVEDQDKGIGVLTFEHRYAKQGNREPRPEWVVSTGPGLLQIPLSRDEHPPSSGEVLGLVTGLIRGERVSVGSNGETLQLTRQTNAAPAR
jgi:hypothetical protein